jgi:NAD(P)-dependent dehydrogenase (short-subunit alcohol dehydrogenase family)
MHAAGWGRIVTISSVAGLNGGGPALCHYAAAKAGLVGLTKAWALELGPQGITCNVVAPGLVDTPLIRAAGMSEEMIREMERRAPLRRIGQPKDVAAAVAYLVSEEASFVTGQVLSPNGGVYL